MASAEPNSGAAAGLLPAADTLIAMYKKMFLIKHCDEQMRATLRAGKIAAPYYSPRGQEVISSAIAVNLRQGDYVITIYRGLHDHLATGVPPRELWAEYAGRVTGSCKGKGGPMHITHPASGVVVTTGIVGSGMPIANGLAWASLIDKTGQVTITNFGDGAANIGAFHESLNLASLWKLPVVFVCQNNEYAEHTRFDGGTAIDSIAKRAAAYTMPGVRVNGNDPGEMWRAAAVAIERARSGEGPTLIEAMTYRFHGHNFGDPAEYIPKEELADRMAKDPVPALRVSLLRAGHATEADLVAIEKEVTDTIADAVEFALASPWPDPKVEMGRDVYAMEIQP